ncbi:MAG: tRNA pseudouridine(13) synthase TruD [Anaerolineae bacterium]|nr:tRNA pseudouridine(13) synthase TruD [Anaerolineae bacterium]
MLNPYLTPDLHGIGGRIKVRNDDFCVQEIPLYVPSGQGEHVYVSIEKTGISTFQAVRRIAGALGIDPRAVGYAGLKDARAVTVQTISIEGVDPSQVEALDLAGIRVLSVDRHTNKLKMGHLRGNRFTIRVRDVPKDAVPVATQILDILARRGVPNYFGEQRFGIRGDTHLLGRELVRQDAEAFVRRFVGMPHPAEAPQARRARQWVEEGNLASSLDAWPRGMEDERRVVRVLLDHPGEWTRAVRSIPNKMLKFFVSAYQSALFNQLLAQRIASIDRLQKGDLAWIHGRGAVFVVQDAEQEQPRADRLEISPSGPLYGYKLTMAQDAPGEAEREMLEEEGLTLEDFRLRGLKFKGARRPLRFPLREVKIEYDEGLLLSFSLPPGCYATTVLNEVIKPSEHAAEE